MINKIDDNKSSKNIGLVLGLFLKLRLLICLARVGNCGRGGCFVQLGGVRVAVSLIPRGTNTN